MQYDTFTVAKENTVKRLEYQMLETDTGIEIKIPMEEYNMKDRVKLFQIYSCLLYTSPSPRDGATSRMPSSA